MRALFEATWAARLATRIARTTVIGPDRDHSSSPDSFDGYVHTLLLFYGKDTTHS